MDGIRHIGHPQTQPLWSLGHLLDQGIDVGVTGRRDESRLLDDVVWFSRQVSVCGGRFYGYPSRWLARKAGFDTGHYGERTFGYDFRLGIHGDDDCEELRSTFVYCSAPVVGRNGHVAEKSQHGGELILSMCKRKGA